MATLIATTPSCTSHLSNYTVEIKPNVPNGPLYKGITAMVSL